MGGCRQGRPLCGALNWLGKQSDHHGWHVAVASEGSVDGKKYKQISMSDLHTKAKTWDSIVTNSFTLGEVATECEKLEKRNKMMVQDGVVYSVGTIDVEAPLTRGGIRPRDR